MDSIRCLAIEPFQQVVRLIAREVSKNSSTALASNSGELATAWVN